MRNEVSLEIYNDVVNKLKSGVGLREIGRTTEINRSTARKIAIKENLIQIPDTPTYKKSYELYKKGESITAISNKLGISRQWLGLYIKQKGEILKNSSKKIMYNEDVFEIINSEEKAYWLGFISADGCINERKSNGGKIKAMSLEIGLSIKDVEHLKKFCKFMGVDETCVKYKTAYLKATNKTYSVCRIGIFSTKICRDLINLGVTPRKSETQEFYEQISEEFIFDYLRGYVDGDGYFRKQTKNHYELCYLATLPFINKMVSRFNIGKSIIKKKTPTTHVYNITMNSNDSKRLIETMYCNPNIYLDRKYHKAIAVLGRNS